MSTDEAKARLQEYERKALERFPFKLVETAGDKALATWQELKAAGQGSPVVLAGDETSPLGSLLDPFGPDAPEDFSPSAVEKTLRLAAGIKFPDDLARQKADETVASLRDFKSRLAAHPDMRLPVIKEVRDGKAHTLSREEIIAMMTREPQDPALGEWPATPEPSIGLSVVRDILTNVPFPKVYVGIAPTDDGTAIPAYLRWGGWNECPHAEYHVAALRVWRERYGAELVGISGNTINVKVATRPKTREEALALAREHYVYCADIIDQGYPSYSALAAYLMANDWWYFWWD